MKTPHPKLPQRKTHKHMSGEEILSKLAAKAQKKGNILAPLAVPAPKK